MHTTAHSTVYKNIMKMSQFNRSYNDHL